MNKIYLFFLALALSLNSISQTAIPSSFNVQFSLRRTNGTPNPNKPLLVKATIYKTAGAIYEKIFSETSNPFGIVSLKVEGNTPNSQFPSANDFANNNLSLSISVDTTNIGGNFFDIYAQQLFAAVPYAIAAQNAITSQKAPGTFEYQYDDSEAGDPAKGINKDVLFQNDTTDPNFFPRLFTNKKNNVWSATEKSYSLLPNNLNATNKTIFFNITANPNLKPRWEINQALTMSNTGLGINLNGTAPSNSKALEVRGAIRFDTLKNSLGGNRMVVADPNGNLSTLAIPSGSGSSLPNGFNQGEMLYFDSISNTWKNTANIKLLNNDIYVANDLNIAGKVFTRDLEGSGVIRFSTPYLINPAPLDSARFLTTDANGSVILHKVKFPTVSGGSSKWNFIFGAKYLEPANINTGLLIATVDTFPTARIINKTSAGAMQITNGDIFQGQFEPTLVVRNRFKPTVNAFTPIGINVETADSSIGYGINSKGGSLFTNINFAGVGIRGFGAIGVRGIGKNLALGGTAIGGYMSSGFNPSGANFLGAGLLVEGIFGASGLIVKEGNSGFGIKYTGQAFSPVPNSTVDISGTFGQSAKIYTFTALSSFPIGVPDTSNIYVITTAGVSTVSFDLPIASNFPNREYTFYLSRIKSNFNFKLTVPLAAAQMFDFKLAGGVSASYIENTNNDIKVKAVSAFYNGNYVWMVTVERMQ
jgi:hypothetical protein